MKPNDDDRRPKRVARTPTLDVGEQGDRSVDLIDAIFDHASDEAERADGPIDQRAIDLAARAQQMAAAGRQRVIRTAGTGAPSDGAPVVSDARAPDTAEIRRLDRGDLERLVHTLQRRRGLPPSATFDGIDDAELVQLARGLRSP